MKLKHIRNVWKRKIEAFLHWECVRMGPKGERLNPKATWVGNEHEEDLTSS